MTLATTNQDEIKTVTTVIGDATPADASDSASEVSIQFEVLVGIFFVSLFFIFSFAVVMLFFQCKQIIKRQQPERGNDAATTKEGSTK